MKSEHSENQANDLHGQVNCNFCKQAIPLSEAYHPEGEPMVLYYCGIDCFDRWKKQKTADEGTEE